MIRTQVRCDKRVSFRDRREGWTCVCPSPGVARTHVATRTESLEPGTLGKHGPGPRHRPYEVAGAKKHQRRLQPRRLSPGVQGHSIKLQQLTNGPCYTLHSAPPHSRQDHETPTSPQTPDNKLHHRHAKVFKPPLRQTPPIVDQHSAGYSSSNPTLPCRFPCRGSLPRTPQPACRHAHTLMSRTRIRTTSR